MNDFRETFLNLSVCWHSDRMLPTISLDSTHMPHTPSFSGLSFFAHAAKFTPMLGFFHLDKLLKCLTCERCPKRKERRVLRPAPFRDWAARVGRYSSGSGWL